ncbi:MAG: hypothetical protein GY747_01215 [Planctomycetes bacterium]|nr:hypothetical protein [Planctomycetota bacterium]MCP4769848.1 hypothetical protein [Planctomycetota bacterium]MCP4859688.1 hypothetical protein [Planctomycetota bacterium]
MKIHLSFLLLAFAAYTGPAANPDPLASGLQNSTQVNTEPETYAEWAESLPVHSLDSTAFRTSAQGKIAVKIQEDGMAIDLDIQLGVEMDYLDLRHFCEDIWVYVALPDIPDFAGFSEMNFAIKILADGDKLFITPEFQDDLLGAQVKAAGIGIEDTTMTLDIELFEELMKLYWVALEEVDVDLSAFLPEGMSVDEFFERGLNSAGWARAYMMTSDILDFVVDSNEVRIKAQMKEELLGNALLLSPGQSESLDGFTYEMSFNRYTGLPTSMEMNMPVDEMVQMDFAEFEMGADLFGPEQFSSAHLDQRNFFPVDTFIQMALASMQATMHDDNGDMAF